MSITTPGVIFDEPSHTYRSTTDNKKYISCTTLIFKYKPKKDWKEIAEKACRNIKGPYYGRDPKEVMAEWEKNKEDACFHGTNFHNKKENQDLASMGVNPVFPEPPHHIYATPFPDYSNLADGILPEMLVWDHYWGIAGKVDRPIFEGDFFDVEDYKTSKSIDLQSYFRNGYYNKILRKYIEGGHEMMVFPLNSLMDCNKVHYELQMSLYAYMIERLTGKTCRNITILHHPRNRETNEIPEEAVRYECIYRKEEVELMLQHYFQKPLPE